MIFVNKYADYSGISIGKVEIPKEFDTTTKEILAKYTKSLSQSQKEAFDNLIVSLKDSGAYDKITDMWIPLISNDVNEALYNVKANSAGVSNDYLHMENDGLTSVRPSIAASVGGQTHHLTKTNISMFTIFYNVNTGSIPVRIGSSTEVKNTIGISGNGGSLVSSGTTAIIGDNSLYAPSRREVVNVNVLAPIISSVNDIELYNKNTKSNLTAGADFVERDVQSILTNPIGIGCPPKIQSTIWNIANLYITILAQELTEEQKLAVRNALIAFNEEYWSVI